MQQLFAWRDLGGDVTRRNRDNEADTHCRSHHHTRRLHVVEDGLDVGRAVRRKGRTGAIEHHGQNQACCKEEPMRNVGKQQGLGRDHPEHHIPSRRCEPEGWIPQNPQGSVKSNANIPRLQVAVFHSVPWIIGRGCNQRPVPRPRSPCTVSSFSFVHWLRPSSFCSTVSPRRERGGTTPRSGKHSSAAALPRCWCLFLGC